MDDLFNLAIEEIALDGENGCSLQRLWGLLEIEQSRLESGLVEKGESIPIDDSVKRYIWEQICSSDIITVVCEDQPETYLPKEQSMVDLFASSNAAKVHLYAAESQQETFSDPLAKTIPSPETKRVYDAIVRSRARGISQAKLAVDLTIAPKTVFHHLRVLCQKNLIIRYPIVINKVSTNQCIAKRYEEIDAGYLRYLQTISSTNTGIDNLTETMSTFLPHMVLAQKMCDVLKNAPNKTMVAYDLMHLLGIDISNKLRRRYFYRCLGYFDEHGVIERRAIPKAGLPTNKAGKVQTESCVRLIKDVSLITETEFSKASSSRPSSYMAKKKEGDPDEGLVIGQGELLLDYSIESQIADVIRQTGSQGVSMRVLQRSVSNVNQKVLVRLLDQMTSVKSNKITSSFENVGRERRSRYYLKAKPLQTGSKTVSSLASINLSSCFKTQGQLANTPGAGPKGRPRKVALVDSLESEPHSVDDESIQQESPCATPVRRGRGRPKKDSTVDSLQAVSTNDESMSVQENDEQSGGNEPSEIPTGSASSSRLETPQFRPTTFFAPDRVESSATRKAGSNSLPTSEVDQDLGTVESGGKRRSSRIRATPQRMPLVFDVFESDDEREAPSDHDKNDTSSKSIPTRRVTDDRPSTSRKRPRPLSVDSDSESDFAPIQEESEHESDLEEIQSDKEEDGAVSPEEEVPIEAEVEIIEPQPKKKNTSPTVTFLKRSNVLLRVLRERSFIDLDYLFVREFTELMEKDGEASLHKIDKNTVIRLAEALQRDKKLHILKTSVRPLKGRPIQKRILLYSEFATDGPEAKEALRQVQDKILLQPKSGYHQYPLDMTTQVTRALQENPENVLKRNNQPERSEFPGEYGKSATKVLSDTGYIFARIARARELHQWLFSCLFQNESMDFDCAAFYDKLPMRLLFQVVGITEDDDTVTALADSTPEQLDTPLDNLSSNIRELIRSIVGQRLRHQIAQCLGTCKDLGLVIFSDNAVGQDRDLSLPRSIRLLHKIPVLDFFAEPPRPIRYITLDSAEIVKSYWARQENRFLMHSNVVHARRAASRVNALKRLGEYINSDTVTEEQEVLRTEEEVSLKAIKEHFRYLFYASNWRGKLYFTEAHRKALLPHVNQADMTTPYSNHELCKHLASTISVHVSLVRRFFAQYEESFEAKKRRRAQQQLQREFQKRHQNESAAVAGSTKSLIRREKKSKKKDTTPAEEAASSTPVQDRRRHVWTEGEDCTLLYATVIQKKLLRLSSGSYAWKSIAEILGSSSCRDRHILLMQQRHIKLFRTKLAKRWDQIYDMGVREGVFERCEGTLHVNEFAKMIGYLRESVETHPLTEREDDSSAPDIRDEELLAVSVDVDHHGHLFKLPSDADYYDTRAVLKPISMSLYAKTLSQSLFTIRQNLALDVEPGIDDVWNKNEVGLAKIAIKMTLNTPVSEYRIADGIAALDVFPELTMKTAIEELNSDGTIVKFRPEEMIAHRVPGRNFCLSDKYRTVLSGFFSKSVFEDTKSLMEKLVSVSEPVKITHDITSGEVAQILDSIVLGKVKLQPTVTVPVAKIVSESVFDDPLDLFSLYIKSRQKEGVRRRARESEEDQLDDSDRINTMKRIRSVSGQVATSTSNAQLMLAIETIVTASGKEGIAFDELFEKVQQQNLAVSRKVVYESLLHLCESLGSRTAPLVQVGIHRYRYIHSQYRSSWTVQVSTDTSSSSPSSSGTIVPRSWIVLTGKRVEEIFEQILRSVFAYISIFPGISEAKLRVALVSVLQPLELKDVLNRLLNTGVIVRRCFVVKEGIVEEIDPFEMITDYKISCYWTRVGSFAQL